MTNLEQIRAKRAYEKAREAAGKDHRKDYLKLTRNLPAMFQTNGLLATWAFHLSLKDKPNHKASEVALKAILEHFQSPPFNLAGSGKTIESIFTGEWTATTGFDNEKLMRLTAEAIAFSGWLKRAAEALCDQ